MAFPQQMNRGGTGGDARGLVGGIRTSKPWNLGMGVPTHFWKRTNLPLPPVPRTRLSLLLSRAWHGAGGKRGRRGRTVSRVARREAVGWLGGRAGPRKENEKPPPDLGVLRASHQTAS